MTTKTSIEWCDFTVNPGIYGCTELSPACRSCYAAVMAHRLARMGQPNYAGLTRRNGSGVHWTGEVRVDYARIAPAFATLPSAKRPARVFVTSMADLFHAAVPFAFIDRVFEEMAARPWHTFMVLSKRADRMAEYDADRAQRGLGWPANVWALTTVENQRMADERTPYLLRVRAKVRGLSMEPLLGPVELDEKWINGFHRVQREEDEDGEFFTILGDPLGASYDTAEDAMAAAGDGLEWWEEEDGYWLADRPRVDWIIAGCESIGPRPGRPSEDDWFRSLCWQAGNVEIPFFLKQAERGGRIVGLPELNGRVHAEVPDGR